MSQRKDGREEEAGMEGAEQQTGEELPERWSARAKTEIVLRLLRCLAVIFWCASLLSMTASLRARGRPGPSRPGAWPPPGGGRAARPATRPPAPSLGLAVT